METQTIEQVESMGDGYFEVVSETRINMAMRILRDLYDSSLSSMNTEDIKRDLNEALRLLRRCK